MIIDKIPPQAIELEQAILANCLMFEHNRDTITFLKPEHFYKDSHQIIYSAIQAVDKCSLPAIIQYLRSEGNLEQAGGINYITRLSDNFGNPTSNEYHARIIQQQYIKREIIRISSQMVKDSYDTSTDCIQLFDEFNAQMGDVESIFLPESSPHKIVSLASNELPTLEREREGITKSGLPTGYKLLDDHFRFKPSSFVIINGHDNVGKTYAILHLAVCSNVMNGWKWILCCLENNEARIRQDLIQSRTGKHISHLSPDEFEKWYLWATENFTILSITNTITAPKLLKIAKQLTEKQHYDAFFIDPYNALELERTGDKYFNSHEYHYSVTNRMRAFIKQTGCCIYLSTHAVTEALRRTHKDGPYAGFPMPPQKADVEGGGKFANRADDFLTIHRYTQHSTDFNQTHIHVRKIKDTATGGRQTTMDDPVILKVEKHHFGLFDEQGNSPITSVPNPTTQFPIKPNIEPDF